MEARPSITAMKCLKKLTNTRMIPTSNAEGSSSTYIGIGGNEIFVRGLRQVRTGESSTSVACRSPCHVEDRRGLQEDPSCFCRQENRTVVADVADVVAAGSWAVPCSPSVGRVAAGRLGNTDPEAFRLQRDARDHREASCCCKSLKV